MLSNQINIYKKSFYKNLKLINLIIRLYSIIIRNFKIKKILLSRIYLYFKNI